MNPTSVRALAGTAMLLFTACAGDYQMQGAVVDPPRELAAFEFTLPSGEVYSTAADNKRPMVVFFGYTHCPDVCPATLADWARIKKALGKKGDNVRYVFVTVDPERDTPVVADQYAKQFDASFVGLSGSSATTENISRAFGARSVRDPSTDSTNYTVSHTGHTFLVDAKGRLIALYPMGNMREPLQADLEALR